MALVSVKPVENPAHAASSVALLQELSRASEQLTRSSALDLPAAPLQLIPLPSHQLVKPRARRADQRNADADPDVVVPSVEVPKVVIEYPVPGAKETHEMAVVGSDMLLVTQQSNSTLVKVLLSPTTGRPISCASFLLGKFWAGLHGLCASQYFENQVWASLQFQSLIIRIDPGLTLDSEPTITQTIPLPASVNGPHCVYECGPDVWTSCKDSSHVVRINYTNTSDYSVYPCSARPIFMARHPGSKNMYASLDQSSKIWCFTPKTTDKPDTTEEIDIPPQYGTTPVGLVAGTDNNVWFTLLGGNNGGSGTFARILESGEFQWFSLTTPIAADAGLIHLAFDWSEHLQNKGVVETQSDSSSRSTNTDDNIHRLWLLSSSLVADSGYSIDAIFSVLVDIELGRITTQQSITLPTQRCATHRILPHRTGLFVSELGISCLAHITGAAALNVGEVPGETSDFYGHFGLGQTMTSYTYELELPKTQRIATRMAPCPLEKPLIKHAAQHEAKKSTSKRATKRARVNSE